LIIMMFDFIVFMWAVGSQIIVDGLGERSVSLSWDAASDTVGVTRYRVETSTGLEWETAQQSLLIEGLEPSTEYSFTVNAYDLAGNQTAAALSKGVITQVSNVVTHQDVYDSLAPHCAGCHSNGDSAYFASFNNFETLVVQNQALVVPGEPDQSIFLLVLTGAGVAPWSSMPPFGSQNYSELVGVGDASLSMESLERWVLEMEGE
jgi:mono/diheme cytochrome c family protein